MVLPSILSSRSLSSEGSTTPTGSIRKSIENLPLLHSPVDFEGDDALERLVRKLGKFTGVKANTMIDNKLRKPLIEELATKRRELFQELLQLAVDERGDVQDWTDKSFATKIIEVVDGTYSFMPPLHPQTRSFLEHATKFLDCRRQLDAKYFASDELQQIARLYVQTDSGGIEADSMEFKQQYRQQATSGTPVKSVEQLYEAANIAQPLFKDIVMRLADRVRKVCGETSETISVDFPKQKERGRALQKADQDYSNRIPGPAISWLYDVLRASIEFASVDQIANFLEVLQNDESIHIVKAKNRFAKPGWSGYRDLILHIQINTLHGFKHICEIQVHHKEFKKLDKELRSQFYYGYFRSYLEGGEDELEDRLSDLEVVAGSEILDNHSLENLLQRKMEFSEIERFITLLSDHLGEYEWAMRFGAKLLWHELNSKGPSSVSVANGYDMLARILQKAYGGQMEEEALLLQTRCLNIMIKQLGKFDLAVAQSHQSIASIHNSKGEPGEAMKHLRVALEIKTMTLGEENLSLAEIYDQMITASLQLKKLVDVVELCERSLGIRSERLAEDHTDLANTYRTLAGVLLRQSKYYDALEMYERSLEIRKKLVNENHESLLEDYRGILHVQFHHGRLNRVQELHKKISFIRLKMSKGKDPLSGKHFIQSLKSLRIAFAPFCLCLNGFWCRKLSSMGISQKYLKGYMVDEAFEGVNKKDSLSDFLKSAQMCLV